MLQIFFGIYLVLGLPAILLLWAALAASKVHDEERYEHQRFYATALVTASSQNPRGKSDLPEDKIVF